MKVKRMQTPLMSRIIGTALAASLIASPSYASKFPGNEPSLGGAVATKAIGQHCSGVLAAPEAAEIDAYIAKASDAITRKNEADKDARSYVAPTAAALVQSLTDTYDAKYRDPANCTPDAREQARDMLERVRNEVASGGPSIPDEASPAYQPHAGAAISAKVIAAKCPGALTSLQRAELEYFVARSYLRRARTAADSDAHYEMNLLQSAEKDMMTGWRTIDCTPQAVAKAKAIAAAVAKDVGTTTP